MPRARSAEDRILSLLARVPFPLGTNEIVAALEVTRQTAHEVLARMERLEHVVRIASRPPGATCMGRPPALWRLPGAVLAHEDDWPRLRTFMPDTVVVTPSKRRAKVTALTAECVAVLEYLDDKDVSAVRITLLSVYRAGREAPAPARVS